MLHFGLLTNDARLCFQYQQTAECGQIFGRRIHLDQLEGRPLSRRFNVTHQLPIRLFTVELLCILYHSRQ